MNRKSPEPAEWCWCFRKKAAKLWAGGYHGCVYSEKWSWIKLISFHGMKLVNWEKMDEWRERKSRRDGGRKEWKNIMCARTFDACD